MVRRMLPLAVAICSACSLPAPRPPRAEFIVATPDSTYWVTSSPAGVTVRGVPMTLARWGGTFHEVYIADVDRSYTDAIFAGERVYARDILTNDSAVVYDDTLVVRLAAAHARAHPAAAPLDPDDDDPEDPSVVVRGETDILDVRGPFALVEHRASVAHVDGEQYDTTRVAVDLRTGRAARPSDLARDSARGAAGAASDDAVIVTAPAAWQRAGYTLVARGDTATRTVSLSLRDGVSHSWPVLTVAGTRPRLYWLDAPPVDPRTRTGLLHAFNSATTYGEDVTYVRRAAPRRGRPPAYHLASAPRR